MIRRVIQSTYDYVSQLIFVGLCFAVPSVRAKTRKWTFFAASDESSDGGVVVRLVLGTPGQATSARNHDGYAHAVNGVPTTVAGGGEHS